MADILSQQQSVLLNIRKQSQRTFGDVELKLDKRHGETVHLPILAMNWPSLIPGKELEKITAAKKKKHRVAPFNLSANQIASPEVLNRLLEYVYNGALDFSKMKTMEIFNVLVAADNFKDFAPLSIDCKRQIHLNLALDNVFPLLKASHEHKQPDIKKFCLDWATKNNEVFVKNREGVMLLGIELFQEVSIELAQLQAHKATSPREVIDKEEAPPSASENVLVQRLKDLYAKMPYSDCVASFGKTQVHFHKALVAVQSEKISQRLSGQGNADPKLAASKDPRPTISFVNDSNIRVDHLSADAFRSLLEYSYFSNADIKTKEACELIPLCKEYGLASLQAVCETKVMKDFDASTVISVLNLTYGTDIIKRDLFGQVKSDCINYILNHFTSVDLNRLKNMQHGKSMSIDLLLSRQKVASGEPLPAVSLGSVTSTESTDDESTGSQVSKDSGSRLSSRKEHKEHKHHKHHKKESKRKDSTVGEKDGESNGKSSKKDSKK